MNFPGAVLLCGLALSAPLTALSEESVSLPSRPGVQTQFFYEGVSSAAAQVILFEGGNGQVTGKNPGFVTKTRKMFAEHNISYAMFAMPSDFGFDNAPQQMVGAYRVSNEHIRDVEVVIAWMRQKSPAPVWLAGVSAGTISIAWLGSRVLVERDGRLTATRRNGRARIHSRADPDHPSQDGWLCEVS